MMAQLLCHLWGDYILQSDWMAQNKRHSWRAAWVHCWFYLLCFGPALCAHHATARHVYQAGLVIFFTHLLIDRFGLARYLVWAKNWIGPKQYWFMYRGYGETWNGEQPTPPFQDCKATGNPPGRPEYLAVWLTIIADNTLHLTINYLALRYL